MPSCVSVSIVNANQSGVKRAGRVITCGYHQTPLGRCFIALTEGQICHLSFVAAGADQEVQEKLAENWPGARIQSDARLTADVIASVFAGAESDAAAVRLLVRGTAFQVEVWQALLKIPPGSVRTYKEVADMIGRPRAARAVGLAVGANSIAWLIPCHRVIRSDGSLGGYRWGVKMKKACLEYEKELEAG